MKKIILTMLLFLVALPLTSIHPEASGSFIDVGTTHRAQLEINYLAEGKIVNGDETGKFNPDKIVTRAEAAAMIGRSLGLDGAKRVTKFSDVSSQSFASGYIQSAVDMKIISGYTDGTFKPDVPVSRGEMALLVSRAFGYDATSSTSAASALMTRGIAQGISKTDFGYTANIKKADFAVFLARAINYKLRIQQEIEYSVQMEVVASSLNIRSGPSTTYGRAGSLPNKSIVEVGYQVGEWVYVRSSGIEGFVHSTYLTGNTPPGENEEPTEPTEPGLTDLNSQVIVIDPGHGGTDPGAVGFNLKEKDVVLDTSLRVKELLAKTPLNVSLTRETDVYLTLAERVAFSKAASGNIFVSIHANAFNSSANGTETYYYSVARNPNVDDSKLLATKIQERVIEAWKLTNRGVKNGNFHVLRENNIPAVLVELGFIDNASDNEKLKSESWRQLAAEAIYFGILDYYKAKGFDVNSLYTIK